MSLVNSNSSYHLSPPTACHRWFSPHLLSHLLCHRNMEIVESFEEDFLDGIFDVSSVLSLAYFILYNIRIYRVVE